MAKRFTPVVDPERARSEQDEESLRKHRQFDTPFALLPKNLNEPKQPKEDLQPVSRPSEDLYQDQNKLWRKKSELFEKQKTWGRETFEYSNPEEARTEGTNVNRKRRPGDAGWTVGSTHGSRGADNGVLVCQRGEVEQIMVRNEKGLWVQQKRKSGSVDEDQSRAESPLPDGDWRCKKCRASNKGSTNLCKECGTDQMMYGHYRERPGEDPRLEAAKPRGRGTADAQAAALKALEERRKKERAVKEDMGLMRRHLNPGRAGLSGEYVPLNSSSQQVRSSKRLRKFDQWQGVQRSDEDAVRVVGRALGGSRDTLENKKPKRVEDLRETEKKERSESSSPERASSPSGSRSASPEQATRTAGEAARGSEKQVVVDFF